ncbi:MAG: hypothetical protein E7399_03045 [Ruminococcaceae bacterium]|nr:hypothetical protein [Oscillospiraceae bacterium]
MQKMKFQFGDCTRQIDLSDVEFVMNYEQAIEEYEQGVQALNREASPSAQLEQICQLFFAMFDKIFGENSAEEMFGTTKSVALCTKAFTVLIRSMDKYANNLRTEAKQ